MASGSSRSVNFIFCRFVRSIRSTTNDQFSFDIQLSFRPELLHQIAEALGLELGSGVVSHNRQPYGWGCNFTDVSSGPMVHGGERDGTSHNSRHSGCEDRGYQ